MQLLGRGPSKFSGFRFVSRAARDLETKYNEGIKFEMFRIKLLPLAINLLLLNFVSFLPTRPQHLALSPTIAAWRRSQDQKGGSRILHDEVGISADSGWCSSFVFRRKEWSTNRSLFASRPLGE